MKSYVHTETGTQTFITALFIIAQSESNQDVLQQVILKKQIAVHLCMECYSLNEISSYKKTWEKFKHI